MSYWKDWPRSTKLLALTALGGVGACVTAIIPSPFAFLDHAAPATAEKISVPPNAALPAEPPLTDLADITQRPLFNADRRPDPLPPPPAAAKPAIALGDLSQFHLVGVVTSGEARFALVRRADGTTLTLRVGDALDGWKVDQIELKGVDLSGGDRKDSLAIPKAENRAGGETSFRAQGE